MLDRLIDVLIDFVGLFQVYTFVDQFERGVVLRCGKYHRDAGPGLSRVLPIFGLGKRFAGQPGGPGLCWILPFNFEDVLVDNVVPDTMPLGIQSLHTADDYACNIQYALQWRITDPKKFLLEIEDGRAYLADIASGLLADAVQSAKWAEVSDPDFARPLRNKINRKARKFGAEVDDVLQYDCSCSGATRLWHEGIALG